MNSKMVKRISINPPVKKQQQGGVVLDAKRIVMVNLGTAESFKQIQQVQPLTIVIPRWPQHQAAEPTGERLSQLIQIGRQYHPICRQAFVERVTLGYYAYDSRIEWRTCTMAAAYAGAFGPASVEKPDFSYSMAVWRLSQMIGWDIGTIQVTGPTGRQNSVADEMIALTDDNLWTRAGVAEWLASIGA